MRSALVRTDRYNSGAIAFHWAMAALIGVNLVLGLFHESLLDGIGWVIPVHKAVGFTVLVLAVARIGWRITHPVPPFPPTMQRWERFAAHAVHYLLYFYLLALTTTGWMMVSGGRKHPISFGFFDVPFLPVSPAAGKWAHGAHGILAWILIALLVVHIGAVIRHYFFLRDGVLARMIPALARRDEREGI
ncbi:hypothetical protein BH09PSE4_BH09PSE4_09350 [soil metagenome]